MSAPQFTDAELTEYVVSRLGKYADRQDLVFELCQATGLDWRQAEAFVQQVQDRQRTRIARRQSPILIIIGIGILLGGVALTFVSARSLILLYQTEPIYAVDPRRSYEILGALVTGIGMIAGALLGLWQALRASSGQ